MVELLTEPKIWLVILLISIWGAAARLPNYYLGKRERESIESHHPQFNPETLDRALGYFNRLGPLPLLLSSIPILGSVLTVSAGIAGIQRGSFLFWVVVSKVIRNWILVILLATIL